MKSYYFCETYVLAIHWSEVDLPGRCYIGALQISQNLKASGSIRIVLEFIKKAFIIRFIEHTCTCILTGAPILILCRFNIFFKQLKSFWRLYPWTHWTYLGPPIPLPMFMTPKCSSTPSVFSHRNKRNWVQNVAL